jgi:hypothetical protein
MRTSASVNERLPPYTQGVHVELTWHGTTFNLSVESGRMKFSGEPVTLMKILFFGAGVCKLESAIRGLRQFIVVQVTFLCLRTF